MVQRAAQETQPKTNGHSDVTGPYLGAAPEHSMAFDVKDVSDIAVPNVSPAEVSAKESNGRHNGAGFVSITLTCACRHRWIQDRQ